MVPLQSQFVTAAQQGYSTSIQDAIDAENVAGNAREIGVEYLDANVLDPTRPDQALRKQGG